MYQLETRALRYIAANTKVCVEAEVRVRHRLLMPQSMPYLVFSHTRQNCVDSSPPANAVVSVPCMLAVSVFAYTPYLCHLWHLLSAAVLSFVQVMQHWLSTLSARATSQGHGVQQITSCV